MADLDKEKLDRLKSDLLTMETFLNAQGLPWLGHQAKNAYRVLVRNDVETFLLDGDHDAKG